MCEVQSELLPSRILDLQGRELRGRRIVHGALARWIGDGFKPSTPFVGRTSRARVGDWLRMGDWKKVTTQITHTCSAPTGYQHQRMLTVSQILQVLSGTHRLQNWTLVSFLGQVAKLHKLQTRTKAQQHCDRDTKTHAPHSTRHQQQIDSVACWSDAHVVHALCGTHHLHKRVSVFILAK